MFSANAKTLFSQPTRHQKISLTKNCVKTVNKWLGKQIRLIFTCRFFTGAPFGLLIRYLLLLYICKRLTIQLYRQAVLPVQLQGYSVTYREALGPSWLVFDPFPLLVAVLYTFPTFVNFISSWLITNFDDSQGFILQDINLTTVWAVMLQIPEATRPWHPKLPCPPLRA